MTQIAKGNAGKLVAFRLKPGDDILRSVEEICIEHGIRNAVFVGGVGSLEQIAYCIPEDKGDGSFSYGEPYVKGGPLSLLSVSGMICRTETGDLLPHIHISASSCEHGVVGGHVAYGCTTLISVDIVLEEVDGMVMGRRYDAELGMPVFDPRPEIAE